MASSQADRLPPSLLAVAFATAIVAGLGGWILGQGSSIGIFGNSPGDHSRVRGPSEQSEVEEDDESDEDDQTQDLKDFSDKNEPCKLVLVVRTDLGMTKGM